MWLSQGINQGLQIGPTILDKSAWDSVAVFSVISRCPQKTVQRFKKFCQVSLLPALNPTLFVGWEEGLGMCDFKEAPQMQICGALWFCPIDCSLDAGETTQPLNQPLATLLLFIDL